MKFRVWRPGEVSLLLFEDEDHEGAVRQWEGREPMADGARVDVLVTDAEREPVRFRIVIERVGGVRFVVVEVIEGHG